MELEKIKQVLEDKYVAFAEVHFSHINKTKYVFYKSVSEVDCEIEFGTEQDYNLAKLAKIIPNISNMNVAQRMAAVAAHGTI